ncbi:MAG: hypothetical protein GY841_20270 [FCB group bacterium]|nr:hypothetical protein [FCB group bacterium]
MIKITDGKLGARLAIQNVVYAGIGMNLRIALFIAVSMFSTTVLATPITVSFNGTIDSQWGGSMSEAGFNIGDAFTGQYTFESTTVGDPSVTNFGGVPPERMIYPNAILSFTATSLGNTLTSSGNQQNGILIDDNLYNRDDYFVVLSDNWGPEMYIDLRSSNTNLFNLQDLPSTLPHISHFDEYAFFRVRIIGDNGNLIYAQGNLDSIQVSSVPLPATLWILASGLGMIRVRLWFKSRTA